jgi:hypothetical protein
MRMKIPKIKKPRKPRAHLPALSPDTRKAISERMNEMPLLQSTRDTVMASLNAAANKKAETPEVVIQTLDEPEKQIALLSMQGYAQTFNGIAARGRNRLMMDLELDSLIEQEANDG